MRKLLTILATSLVCAVSAGAVETAELQRRIDELAAKGGGTLTIAAGEHHTGALFFRKGVNLHLDKGATLVGTDDAASYPKRLTRIEGRTLEYFPALINADGCDGFTITGEGTIDGHGLPAWKQFWAGYEAAKKAKRSWSNVDNGIVRPRLLYVSNSKNVDVSGVTFKNSKFWTTHYYRCENVFIHDCEIAADIIDGVRGPSTDAIDLDATRHVVISNVIMAVNDDAVVLKGGKGAYSDDPAKRPDNGPTDDILVVDCTFREICHHCLTFGSECVWGRNVTMRDCRAEGPSALLYLKLRSDTPQHYSNIRVERITGRVKNVFRVKPWTQWFIGEPPRVFRSDVNGVTLSNLNLECDRFFDAARSPDYDLSDLTLENLRIRCRVDAKWDDALFSDTKTRNLDIQ